MTRERVGLKAKRRLKNQVGFSLAETLLAVLIMRLVSVIVANGIPLAKNVYDNVIVGANAQVLLSTTITALRNELGTAKDVEPSADGTSVTYYSASISAMSQIYMGPADSNAPGSVNPDTIKLQPYIDPETGVPIQADTARDLVTRSASNRNLYVTYTEIEKSGDIVTITGLSVSRKSDTGSPLAHLDTLNIRIIPISGEAA